MTESVSLEQLQKFLAQAITLRERSSEKEDKDYWLGRVESYQHIICLLNPEFFGTKSATEIFVVEIWERDCWEQEAEGFQMPVFCEEKGWNYSRLDDEDTGIISVDCHNEDYQDLRAMIIDRTLPLEEISNGKWQLNVESVLEALDQDIDIAAGHLLFDLFMTASEDRLTNLVLE